MAKQAKFALNDDSVVVIVGSGAGGGTLANELAQRGVNINYAYATVGRGSSRAAIVLGVSNARKAAQAIK